MKNNFTNSIILVVSFLLITCQPAQSKTWQSEKDLPNDISKTGKPRNIIFMIGDGMGTAHIFAALTAKKGKLEIARCTHYGFCLTQSANNYVTDSSAGATAFSTGKKTNNSMLGISPEGDTLKTIIEIAEEQGVSTGLIATSTIPHATPAGFVAHNESRYNYEEIALDFLNTDVDIIVGGGRRYFENRQDGRNLSDLFRTKGYDVVYSVDELKMSQANKIVGMLYSGDPPTIEEGRGNMLGISSQKAVELLNANDNGFFLMIEGSQIDWAGHDNNSKYLVNEAVDFDNVVGKVLDFAEQDGETLVVITADHETGGYVLKNGNVSKGKVHGVFALGEHSGVMVPVFAYGPGAESFTGFIDNTEFFTKFVELLGLTIE